MYCGFSWRPPRRTAFAGRLVSLACILALAFGISAGPASAYPCKPREQTPVVSGTRTLASLAQSQEMDCDPKPAPRRPLKRREADPMSFAFFIGILVAVVLVPVALGKREEYPPQEGLAWYGSSPGRDARSETADAGSRGSHPYRGD
jgi:hypothetical protein